MSDNVIPIFDTQQAERQFRHESGASITDGAFNVFPVCKHCAKPLNEWRANEVCPVRVSNFNSAAALQHKLNRLEAAEPVIAAANLVNVLKWLQQNGSAFSLDWSATARLWSCSWEVNGARYVTSSRDVCDAVRAVLVAARSHTIIDGVQ